MSLRENILSLNLEKFEKMDETQTFLNYIKKIISLCTMDNFVYNTIYCYIIDIYFFHHY
jgi:hypothetical protein